MRRGVGFMALFYIVEVLWTGARLAGCCGVSMLNSIQRFVVSKPIGIYYSSVPRALDALFDLIGSLRCVVPIDDS